jgi:hypothetical protein
VAYRVIAAQQQRDHATIARFVERHQDALAGLFGGVLGLCPQAGLATVGVIAIDGTKMHADASRDADLDHEQIAREILEEAQAVDAAEDEVSGEARRAQRKRGIAGARRDAGACGVRASTFRLCCFWATLSSRRRDLDHATSHASPARGRWTTWRR